MYSALHEYILIAHIWKKLKLEMYFVQNKIFYLTQYGEMKL